MSQKTRAASYYTRWAKWYDVIARFTPGMTRLRRICVNRLGLTSGMTVVDMGAGPGPNLGLIRSQIHPDGNVIGIDVSRGQLERANRHRLRHDWGDVAVLRGDATRPPVDAVDGIIASFVIGMFDEPAAVIDNWCEIVGPGGRVGLLHFAKSDRWYGLLPNAFLALLVLLSTPGYSLTESGKMQLLDERVRAGQRRLLERCDETTVSTHWGGLIHMYTGTVAD